MLLIEINFVYLVCTYVKNGFKTYCIYQQEEVFREIKIFEIIEKIIFGKVLFLFYKKSVAGMGSQCSM